MLQEFGIVTTDRLKRLFPPVQSQPLVKFNELLFCWVTRRQMLPPLPPFCPLCASYASLTYRLHTGEGSQVHFLCSFTGSLVQRQCGQAASLCGWGWEVGGGDGGWSSGVAHVMFLISQQGSPFPDQQLSSISRPALPARSPSLENVTQLPAASTMCRVSAHAILERAVPVLHSEVFLWE